MEKRIKIRPIIYNKKKIHTHQIDMVDGSIGILKDSEHFKLFKCHNYNYFFDKRSGLFMRWGDAPEKAKPPFDKKMTAVFLIWKSMLGKDAEDAAQFFANIETDADMSKSVPEILDLEISEICDGVPGIGPCAFCYKSNTGNKGENMSFKTYKKLFARLPKTITQVAFGIGNLYSHPGMWDIFNYTREQGVIPNVTINGNATEEDLDRLASVMGATAVSVYDKELSYNAVKGLTDRGMKQVNIHQMVSEETYEASFQVLRDRLTDKRLEKMNAVVLLALKPKGRSVGKFTQLSQEKFNKLFKFSLDNNLGVGFDSCSAAKVNNFIQTDPEKYDFMSTYVEPCEATHYSTYINVRAEYFPCSFAEGEGEWKEGINVFYTTDFMKDIWNNPKVRRFGEKVRYCRECNIGCPIFEV